MDTKQSITNEAISKFPSLENNMGPIIPTPNFPREAFPITPEQVDMIAKLLNEIYDEIEENIDDDQYEDFEESQPFSSFITELAYYANLTK